MLNVIIDPIASIFEDLMGCAEGDTECEKLARKYASYIIYGGIALIIIVIGMKVYKYYKGLGGEKK